MPNPNALDVASHTHFTLSGDSGPLALYEADQTDIGRFVPGALEQSTTDIAMEFTKLILTQQSYTTAVQAYTVVNKMAQVASDLKR